MSDLPLKATLKAGTGYDAPWLTVDGHDQDDLAMKLKAIAGGDVLQSLIEAANLLKAVNSAGPLLAHAAPVQQAPAPVAAPVQQWAAPAPQQQAAPPQWAGAPSGPANGSPHPENRPCPMCNTVLQYKAGVSKAANKPYKLWACPNQRNRDDGHLTEFIN